VGIQSEAGRDPRIHRDEILLKGVSKPSPMAGRRRSPSVMTALQPLFVGLLALASASNPLDRPAKPIPAGVDSPLGWARGGALGWASCVEQLSSGDLLVTFGSGGVAVLDPETGATVGEYADFEDCVPSFWLTPDQRHIAIGVKGDQLEIRPFDGTALTDASADPAKAPARSSSPARSPPSTIRRMGPRSPWAAPQRSSKRKAGSTGMKTERPRSPFSTRNPPRS
jgi:hypothetical protein